MIKEKFEELKKEKIFQDIKDRGKLGKLFLVFAITDSNLNLEQLDFNFIKDNIINCFSFKNGLWKKSKSEEKRKVVYEEINLDVKSIESVLNKVNKFLKNKNLSVNKFILVLQNLNNELIFNVTCLCNDFYVFKVTLNAKNLEIIDTKLYNLANFFSQEK